MKQMNKELFSTQFPSHSLFFQTLSKEEQDEYLELYEDYSKLFLKYLQEKLDLKSYDKILSQSDLHFKKVNKEEMDIYQFLSSSFLDYFYIHNNIYIERLTNSEKTQIKNLVDKTELLSQDALKFVEKTYKRCVLEGQNITNNDYVNFGPEAPQFYKPSNAIVVGFRFDVYEDEVEQTDEEWDAQNEKREEFLIPFLEKMEEELTKKMPLPVCIIWYDDESVYVNVDQDISNELEVLQEKYIEQLKKTDEYKQVEDYLIGTVLFPNGWHSSTDFVLKTKLLHEACEKNINLKNLEDSKTFEETVSIKKK